MAPSLVAKSSQVYRMQHDPSQRLVNDRPETDTNCLPIALGFGRSLDVLKDDSTDHTHSFNRRTFEEKVGEFVIFMNECYPDERSRNKKVVDFVKTFKNVVQGVPEQHL